MFPPQNKTYETTDTLPEALTSLTTTQPIFSKSAGYVQLIDIQTITKVALETNQIIRLSVQTGDFVFTGDKIGYALPEPQFEESHKESLNTAVLLGSKRTPAQDIRFLIQELVEIAVRALSPGINDPITANACLNWLGEAIVGFPTGISNERELKDESGDARLYFPGLTFERVLEESFGTLRHYCATDPTAARYHMNVLTRLRDVFTGDERNLLETEITRFKQFCKETLTDERFSQVFKA